MRSVLALGAAGLTSVAAAISALERPGDGDELRFFAGLTLAGLVAAGAFHPRLGPHGHVIGAAIAAAWTTAGVWIGALLLFFQAACGCSQPEPIGPPATYLGLTATAWHLAAMYGSNALILVAAFGRSTFLDRPLGRSRDLG